MKLIHYHDLKHEMKIPSWEENKAEGYKATLCGYQRKQATCMIKDVTCKRCIKAYKESGK